MVLCYAPIDLRGFENASDNRFLDSVCGGAGRDSLDDFCINQHVWEQYPPTYLWQCADDDIVSPDNYEKMVDALMQLEYTMRESCIQKGARIDEAPCAGDRLLVYERY